MIGCKLPAFQDRQVCRKHCGQLFPPGSQTVYRSSQEVPSSRRLWSISNKSSHHKNSFCPARSSGSWPHQQGPGPPLTLAAPNHSPMLLHC
ncbi:hypothetical protein L3Q82_019087 [Scortum barcoo]|uniref:Uncharacterized protein n=1 Tax=Scortum barcoo TaxID=214431 RepID=A0ACB8VFW2_9TELE|nr:hypothetical protein L3Q82_019087 [Scortum barcoo]